MLLKAQFEARYCDITSNAPFAQDYFMGFLCFHMNFWIVFLLSVKNINGILMDISLNL
jgi:hypothetical protein